MSDLDPYRDIAQAMVTAVQGGDRDTAVELADQVDEPMVLALVLADLAAHIHGSWARSVHMNDADRAHAWQALMADIETWRMETRR